MVLTGPHTATSRADLAIASVAWGFTLGFGFLTAWTAIKQTQAMKRRHARRSAYIWLVWGELIANLGFGIISFLLLSEACEMTYFLLSLCFVMFY
jgi:hypothetical protein